MANAFQEGYMGNFAGQAGQFGQGLIGGLGGQALGALNNTDPTIALQRQREQAADYARSIQSQFQAQIDNAHLNSVPRIVAVDLVKPTFATFREELQHEVDKWLAPAHR